MMYTMEIIAVVESDDYGPAVILDPEMITIIRCEDFYLGATRCVYTDRPITCELTSEVANSLIKKGVKCLDIMVDEQR